MTHPVPTLLAGLVDDAAVFPPGSAALRDAVPAHRAHRAAWYRDLVGPLLLPVSALDRVPPLLEPGERLRVGLIGDTGIDGLEAALDAVPAGLEVRQVEVAVARRGEDPQPGLRRLRGLLGGGSITGYAEIPLAWGLMDGLDTVARDRAGGVPVAAKFRTGGLAAELFPTPDELASVLCACRDRGLPFKLTAGLHHATRHADPVTGFVHHGFLNILAAALVAERGAAVAEVTGVLAGNDAAPLLAEVGRNLDRHRPLWIGFGSCSIDEPLTDLIHFGLMEAEDA